MINGRTLSPGEAIYTFVANDGRNIHIHAERLRIWLASSGHKVEPVPVFPELVKDLLAHNVVDQRRCIELLGKEKLDPIIMCITGAPASHPSMPAYLLVDGHHRYTLAHMLKLPVIPGYFVKKRIWNKFRIVNVPALSKQQLEDLPITPRNY